MKDCKNLLSQCHRIQGQLTALESMIERSESCEDVVSLALAIDKSFDTLKRRMLEWALRNEFGLSTDPAREKKLETIFKLANS